MWGCTSMKGPDYRPELEPNVWEKAWSGSLQLPPPHTTAGNGASEGGERTDGKGKGRGRVVLGGYLSGIPERVFQVSGRTQWWDAASWEGSEDQEDRVLTALPLQGSCTSVA